MNARQAEDYLLDLELFGMRFGLDRMHRLMTALGMPQRRFASIHVVGTNGKSSTARMIAAILERHGLRTGSYTSPHLRSFAERIEVGGSPLCDDEFAAAVERAARAARLVDQTLGEGDRVTQFEALTAAAYHELARRQVEVAVVEAGLGGRYDATNVIPSKVQVLTNVALDHTRWLGPTLADIAAEKLAVVPDHGHLVTGPLDPELDALADEVAAARHARRTRAPIAAVARPRLGGALQARNFALAAAASEAFRGTLDPHATARAAEEIEIPGRLQLVAADPLVVHDGAHNPAGAEALAQTLPELVGDRGVTALMAILDDKDAAGILRPLLPACRHVVFTRCAAPRSLPPATLASLAAKLGFAGAEVVLDPAAAMTRARALAGRRGAVLVTGSLHLISDLVRDAPAARASRL